MINCNCFAVANYPISACRASCCPLKRALTSDAKRKRKGTKLQTRSGRREFRQRIDVPATCSFARSLVLFFWLAVARFNAKHRGGTMGARLARCRHRYCSAFIPARYTSPANVTYVVVGGGIRARIRLAAGYPRLFIAVASPPDPVQESGMNGAGIVCAYARARVGMQSPVA